MSKRKKTVIVGGISLLIPVIRAIVWAVDKAGDIDFVVKNRESIVDIIGAPWFAGVFAVLGLALIVFATQRKQIPHHNEAPDLESDRHPRRRPTAIRLRQGASNARLEGITGVGDLDLIDNEGAPNMQARGVHLRRPSGLADNTVIFYQTRGDLPDLLEHIARYEVVWALWHTATQADNRDIWLSKRIKKLVLIDPSSPYLKIQSAGLGRNVEEQQLSIQSATARAQKEGVNVKWFVGPIPSALTIGNPETNPVILVEPLMVYTTVHDRQSYQLDTRHPQALKKNNLNNSRVSGSSPSHPIAHEAARSSYSRLLEWAWLPGGYLKARRAERGAGRMGHRLGVGTAGSPVGD